MAVAAFGSGWPQVQRPFPKASVEAVTGLGEALQCLEHSGPVSAQPVGCGGGGDGEEDGRVMFATVILKNLDHL